MLIRFPASHLEKCVYPLNNWAPCSSFFGGDCVIKLRIFIKTNSWGSFLSTVQGGKKSKGCSISLSKLCSRTSWGMSLHKQALSLLTLKRKMQRKSFYRPTFSLFSRWKKTINHCGCRMVQKTLKWAPYICHVLWGFPKSQENNSVSENILVWWTFLIKQGTNLFPLNMPFPWWILCCASACIIIVHGEVL